MTKGFERRGARVLPRTASFRESPSRRHHLLAALPRLSPPKALQSRRSPSPQLIHRGKALLECSTKSFSISFFDLFCCFAIASTNPPTASDSVGTVRRDSGRCCHGWIRSSVG